MRYRQSQTRNGFSRSLAAFTLIEMVVVLMVVGIIAAVAAPSFTRQARAQALKDVTRDIATAMTRARTEAIRTGNVHIVFVLEDAEGNAITDAGGEAVDVLVLNDGAPGSSNQNCVIDTNEPVWAPANSKGLAVGLDASVAAAPFDQGAGDRTTGSTMLEPPPGTNRATWTLFMPTGIPYQFNDSCTLGTPGSGAGAFYVQADQQRYAVVLRPLGGVRVHAYDANQSVWTN